MSLKRHYRLNNKKWCELYDFVESLTEIGGYGQVGIGMIQKLQEIIREAYKAGYKDAEKNRRMQTRKSSSTRRICR